MPQERDRVEGFLSKHELRLKLKYLGEDRPAYRDDDVKLPHYIVTIRRVNGPKLSYDFWHGPLPPVEDESHEPTAYEILVSLGEISRCSPNPDEVYEEFGEMKPSQAIGMANFAKRVRKFLTRKELVEIRSIKLEGSRYSRAPRKASSEGLALKQAA